MSDIGRVPTTLNPKRGTSVRDPPREEGEATAMFTLLGIIVGLVIVGSLALVVLDEVGKARRQR